MDKPQADLTRDQKMSRQTSELHNLREKQILVKAGQLDEDWAQANRTCTIKDPGVNVSRVRALEAQGYVHVFTRTRNLSMDQKQFINEDKIVKIHAREFDRRVKDGAFTAYDDVEVIHDPRNGAPTTYALKPDQVNVDEPIKSDRKATEALAKETARLEKVDAHLKERTLKLSQAEKDLQDREAELNKKEQELNSDKGSISDSAKAISGKAAELQNKEQELNAKQAEIDKKEAELKKRETELNKKKTPEATAQPEGEKKA